MHSAMEMPTIINSSGKDGKMDAGYFVDGKFCLYTSHWRNSAANESEWTGFSMSLVFCLGVLLFIEKSR